MPDFWLDNRTVILLLEELSYFFRKKYSFFNRDFCLCAYLLFLWTEVVFQRKRSKHILFVWFLEHILVCISDHTEIVFFIGSVHWLPVVFFVSLWRERFVDVAFSYQESEIGFQNKWYHREICLQLVHIAAVELCREDIFLPSKSSGSGYPCSCRKYLSEHLPYSA